MSTAVEERIAQLMKQRGVDPNRPRRPQPRPVTTEAAAVNTTPADPVASRSLPASWRKIPDSVHNHDRQRRVQLETNTAAWAIARCLGPDWYAVKNSQYRNRMNYAEIHHRDGYGISISRCWRDTGRLKFKALEIFRNDTDLPTEITVAETRTFGSIAADVHRRLISQGVEHHAQERQRYAEERRETNRRENGLVEGIVRAAGGRMKPEHRRQNYCHRPECYIPGGEAWVDYNGNIEMKICLAPEQAQELAQALGRIAKGRTND